MKTILLFNMNSESDQDRYTKMIKGPNMASLLFDLRGLLRRKYKSDQEEVITRDEFWELVKDHDVGDMT